MKAIIHRSICTVLWFIFLITKSLKSAGGYITRSASKCKLCAHSYSIDRNIGNEAVTCTKRKKKNRNRISSDRFFLFPDLSCASNGAILLPQTLVISDSATQTSLTSSARSEDFQPFANRSAPLCHSLARLVFRKRAVLDGVRIVTVGTAEGAGVRPEDGAKHSSVHCLQDMGAVNFLWCAVIPTEDAHFGLRFAPLSLFASSVHGEQVEAREASLVRGGISVPQLRITSEVFVWPEKRDALFEIIDRDWRGARGRAVAVQGSVVGVPAVPNYAGANRGIVLQSQSRFKRLGYRVRAEGRTVDLIFGDKCRQPEVVVPKIKGVIIR